MDKVTQLLIALVFAVSTGYVVFSAPLAYKVFVIGGVVVIGVLMAANQRSRASK